MKKVCTKLASLLLALSLLFVSLFLTPHTLPVYADPLPSNTSPSTNQTERNPSTSTPENPSTENQNTNEVNPQNQSNPTNNSTNGSNSTTTPNGSTTDTTSTNTENQEPVTCTSQIGAVGWIICPTTGLLAKGIDALYSVIESLLSVKPLEMGNKSPVYQVWTYMRNIANICFIIFLLVIIYSQITGLGINNYGIKKSLPRLIITAIIVNFSFLACAIAVDISNIIGNSLKDFLASVADNAISSGAIDASKNTGFYALFTTIAAGGIGATLLLAFPGGPLGLLLAIIPVIIGGIISVVIGLLVLGLRQALVIFLVAVSPIAFVLYILPNTEKHFQKWKGHFIQMLVFYPMFSMLFGVTKLASMIFITSATTPFGIIIGVAIQVLPLFLAVSLMKMSGTALGTVSNRLNALGNKASLSTAKSFAPIQALNRQKAIENAMKRKRSMNLLPWYWGGAIAANSALRQHRFEDELKTRDDTLRRYRDEDLDASRRGARILYRDKFGRAVYDKRVYGKEGDLERTTDFVEPKNKVMEYTYQNRVAKLAADAQHIKTEDALGNMSDYLEAYNKGKNPFLEQLAKNQTENFLNLKTAESSKKRNDYNANKFYADTVRNAARMDSNDVPLDAKEFERYVSAGAGTDAWYINDGKLSQEKADSRFIALHMVAADAVDAYEAERRNNVNRLTTYMDKMVTLDASKLYRRMFEHNNIDGVIAGNNVLSRRGDYDKIAESLIDYMDKGSFKLGDDATNVLALNLMGMKDAAPSLGRFGKFINMETWRYTNGERKTAEVDVKQYVTGKVEGEDNYTTKINLATSLEGTSFAKIDRTATNVLDLMINQYDNPDGEIRKQVFNAIRPALISAFPTFASGSEQIVNLTSFLTGLNKKQLAGGHKDVDNIESIANEITNDQDFEKKSQTAISEIKNYLSGLTTKNASDMKTDVLNGILTQLTASHYKLDPSELNGLSEDEKKTKKQEALQKAQEEAKQDIVNTFLGGKNKIIETFANPNTSLFDNMKGDLKEIIKDAVMKERKEQEVNRIEIRQEAQQKVKDNKNKKSSNDDSELK